MKNDERLKQIRERWAQASFPKQVFTAHVKQDIDFLLSALENRATLARELAVIVDAGTCDDPDTALSKLHKIQHVAATRMRDACVEKMRALPIDHRDDRRSPLTAESFKALAITAIESLTLDQLEQKESK